MKRENIDETTSSKDVAAMIGVSLPTLKRWLSRTRTPKPKKIVVGKRSFWRWTEQDVEKLRNWKFRYYHHAVEQRPRRCNVTGGYKEPLSEESRQAWIKFLKAKSPTEAKHWRTIALETQFKQEDRVGMTAKQTEAMELSK